MAQVQQVSTEAKPSVDEKLAETLSLLTENIDDIKGLVELLIELKRSGVLDSLMLIVNRFDELIHYLFQDPAIFRALSLIVDGSLGVFNQLSAEDIVKLKGTVQVLGSCLSKNASSAITNAKPVNGLMGLLKVLGDKDVQRGLGIAIELLRTLGKCSSGSQKK